MHQILQADRGRRGLADPDSAQVRTAEKPAITAREEAKIENNNEKIDKEVIT